MNPTQEDMDVLYGQYLAEMKDKARAQGYPKEGRNPDSLMDPNWAAAGTVSFILAGAAVLAALGVEVGMTAYHFAIAAAILPVIGVGLFILAAIKGEDCLGCK